MAEESAMRLLAIPIVVLVVILFFRTSDREIVHPEHISAFRMSAVSLSRTYLKDPAAADQRYRDRLIQVSGQVARVEQDMSGQLAIILQGSQSRFSGVECEVDQAQLGDVKDLRSGQRILVKGVGAGKTIHVRLSDCLLLHVDSLESNETLASLQPFRSVRSTAAVIATRRSDV